eukprot:TRINITY_DN1279_c0_g6_i1.p1 TRINITY_DN1279_c0_g6~~TRINITY_DN1279_c0_g6_i1.p1  ORF type:complete len:160 (-),score=38.32 TRINITY_DN1279_c0_g6_i1:218-697(-)
MVESGSCDKSFCCCWDGEWSVEDLKVTYRDNTTVPWRIFSGYTSGACQRSHYTLVTSPNTRYNYDIRWLDDFYNTTLLDTTDGSLKLALKDTSNPRCGATAIKYSNIPFVPFLKSFYSSSSSSSFSSSSSSSSSSMLAHQKVSQRKISINVVEESLEQK